MVDPVWHTYDGPLSETHPVTVHETYAGDKMTYAYIEMPSGKNGYFGIFFDSGRKGIEKISLEGSYHPEPAREPSAIRPAGIGPSPILEAFCDAIQKPATEAALRELYEATPTNADSWLLAAQLRNAQGNLAEKITAKAEDSLHRKVLINQSAFILSGYYVRE